MHEIEAEVYVLVRGAGGGSDSFWVPGRLVAYPEVIL
jgi:hypothetical protein